MGITKFNINKKGVDVSKASSIGPGLMTAKDKIALDALVAANMAGGDISNVTISGPSVDVIKPQLDEINSTLHIHSEKLNNLDTALMYSLGYCGRVWDESQSTPKAKTYCGSLEMLRVLPDILGLGCYLVQPDHTRRKLDPKNHYKFTNGQTAKLDGSMGHYQWGWDKPFYISFWKEGNLFYEAVSLEPIKDHLNYRVPVGSMSACGHAAYDAENQKLCSFINMDPNFRGGQRTASLDEDPEKTLLGRCVTNMPTTTFMTAAHKVGEGWFAGSMRMSAVLKILFEIIMGTRNCQAPFNSDKDSDGLYQGGLGDGVTGLFEGNWNVWTKYNNGNPFLSLEICVDKGDACCVSDEMSITYLKLDDTEVTKTYRVPVFFGLKNPYGYIWRVSEDEFGLAEAEEPYRMQHYARPLLMSGDYTYANTAGCKMLAVADPGEYYIKNLSYENLEIFPYGARVNGSASTYHCDYFWYYNPSASALRAVFRGGGALNGSSAGLSSVHVNNAASFASGGIGVALCEFAEEFPIEPEAF